MQTAGFWGPVGFDVMRYETATGEIHDRVCQDINARHTMGRLASGWRRYLQEDEQALWIHSPAQVNSESDMNNWWEQFRKTLPVPFRMIRTSPFTVGQQLVRHQTALIIGNDVGTIGTDLIGLR